MMLGLNQIKKFIYLSIFLVSFSFTGFAQGNAEISAHFGMKFGSKLNLKELTNDAWADQKNMPFHFGADAVYRHMMNDTGSFGVGLRYRFALTGEKDYESEEVGPVTSSDTHKYRFTHHRVALLANYRFHMDQFFVGPVLGIDLWKYLKFSYNTGGTTDTKTELMSNQFLWNNITGQLGLEVGYNVTDNFLVKLEAGYDLSSFGFSGDEHCKRGTGTLNNCGEQTPIEGRADNDGGFESEHKLRLNGFYATLGIGWFFG